MPAAGPRRRTAGRPAGLASAQTDPGLAMAGAGTRPARTLGSL